MTAKKNLILYILKILESNTDENNPMRQTEITEWLNSAMPCDRKTVNRNIKTLQEMGYPIIKTPQGFYMDTKKFTVEESKFIIDAVMASAEKSDAEKLEIADKLSFVLTRIYRERE